MPRSMRACRTVRNARKGPNSVRWVTFAIIAAHISRVDNVLRNDKDSISRFTAANSACIDRVSASSRFTSGICDIVTRMSGNAFSSCSLDVFSSIPVRETVRESSEPGEQPAVRFPPPPLFSLRCRSLFAWVSLYRTHQYVVYLGEVSLDDFMIRAIEFSPTRDGHRRLGLQEICRRVMQARAVRVPRGT
jgi:hypothetical protein